MAVQTKETKLQEIKNYREALNFFRSLLLDKGFKMISAKVRHRRHWLITARYNHRMYRLYLIFQREPFHKFKKLYPEEGEALTMNREVLTRLLRERISRVFWCLKDGTIYMGNPETILNIVDKHGWTRTTEKTGETVIHIPIKRLKNVPS